MALFLKIGILSAVSETNFLDLDLPVHHGAA